MFVYRILYPSHSSLSCVGGKHESLTNVCHISSLHLKNLDNFSKVQIYCYIGSGNQVIRKLGYIEFFFTVFIMP